MPYLNSTRTEDSDSDDSQVAEALGQILANTPPNHPLLDQFNNTLLGISEISNALRDSLISDESPSASDLVDELMRDDDLVLRSCRSEVRKYY